MARIALVIPTFRARASILKVLAEIGPEVWRIYVVDDGCPQQSGRLVAEACPDPRVRVIENAVNQGVGGAVKTGYRSAIADGADVIVKLDADGQMNPRHITRLVAPILLGHADYTKGNRFFDLDHLGSMPPVRVFGNAVLSFFSKLSSGYWDVFDPTNGYTAIHAEVAAVLPLDKISDRFYFESDMLFRLGTLRAVVMDVPMVAVYGEERSNLDVARVVPEFLFKHAASFLKRIFYVYFLRGMSAASLELVAGVGATLFGGAFGLRQWVVGAQDGRLSSAGTVMLAALPVIIGLQFLLAFLNYDVSSVPRVPIHRTLGGRLPDETTTALLTPRPPSSQTTDEPAAPYRANRS